MTREIDRRVATSDVVPIGDRPLPRDKKRQSVEFNSFGHARLDGELSFGFLYPAWAEHTVFVVSVRNGSRRVRS